MKIDKNFNKKSGVYKITSLLDGKIYIGSSVDIYYRLDNGHLGNLRELKHANSHLQNAFNLYGEENFTFEVLEFCEPEITYIREQFYLDTLLFAQEYISSNFKDTRFKELGYNIRPLAEEKAGYLHVPETIEKISKKAKQRFIDEPERKQFYKDKMAEPERKQKSIDDSKKLWEDPEYRVKIHNPESRAKQAKSLSKKWHTDKDYRDRRIETWNKTKSDPDYVNLFKQQVVLKHIVSGEEFHFTSVDECWQFFFKQHLYPDSLYQLSKSGDTYQNYKVIYLPKPKKKLK